MVTECGGLIHDSWYDSGEEAAVGSRTMKERVLFLCDDYPGQIITVRAQHGMSGHIGVSIAITHSRCLATALRVAPSFFHVITTAPLPHLVVSGLKCGQRVLPMHSL